MNAETLASKVWNFCHILRDTVWAMAITWSS